VNQELHKQNQQMPQYICTSLLEIVLISSLQIQSLSFGVDFYIFTINIMASEVQGREYPLIPPRPYFTMPAGLEIQE